ARLRASPLARPTEPYTATRVAGSMINRHPAGVKAQPLSVGERDRPRPSAVAGPEHDLKTTHARCARCGVRNWGGERCGDCMEAEFAATRRATDLEIQRMWNAGVRRDEIAARIG